MLQFLFFFFFAILLHWYTAVTFPPLIPVMFFFKLIFSSVLLHVLNATFGGNFYLRFLYLALCVQAFIKVELLGFYPGH